jgi:CO/xanthine dehydrogenase Mo-binding subunit
MALTTIGRPVPRIDARGKVEGRTEYTVNVELPGMLTARALRSPLPHARIARIDASAARALPGVAAVVTGEDLPELGIEYLIGPAYRDQAPVAVGKVRFVGDIVAAVAARDRDTAEEALRLIQVEYEELPAVFDVREAMRPGAPAVHDSVLISSSFADLMEVLGSTGRLEIAANTCFHYTLRRGNVEEGFAASDEIFDDVFTSPATQHCDMEPHATVAAWDSEGRLNVWSATQSPSYVRSMLAGVFHLPEAKVRVLVSYLGGGFGSKLYMKLEPLVALLARRAGRPVKMVLAREEEFATITKHGVTVRLRTGVKRDGTLRVRTCEVLWDTGAYADIGPRIVYKSGYTAGGPYRIPNITIDSYCVYTNRPPAGALRGFGISQLVWAYESQMDIIARRLGMDPVRIRQLNLLEEGDIQATGTMMENIGLQDCLREASRAVGWGAAPAPEGPGAAAQAPARRRGRGIACALKAVITPSISVATVQMNGDGSVSVMTSTVDMGQGSNTILSQIAAEELGIPVDRVAIVHPDTDVTPYDLLTAGSRSTFHMGNAVRLAAQEVRGELFAMARKLLGDYPEEFDLWDGRVAARGRPDKVVTLQDLFLSRFGMPAGNVVGRGVFQTHHDKADPVTGQCPNITAYWMLGCSAVEVEVDTETGQVRILRMVTAVDVGRPLNVPLVRQQITGAAVLGVGQTMLEHLVLDGGQIVNGNLADYHIPSFLDLPDEMAPIIVEVPHKEGPYGAKGIGETGVMSVSPAVANAIADACGVRVKDLPLTAERVFALLQAAGGQA